MRQEYNIGSTQIEAELSYKERKQEITQGRPGKIVTFILVH